MSFLDALSGSDPKTKTKLPDWITGPAKDYIGQSQDIATQPYQPYSYPRIAPFSADQNKAMGMLRDYNLPNLSPTTNAAQTPRLIDDIGPGGNMQAYMDPWIQNVIDATIRDMGDVWAGQDNALKARMHQAGAFGDAGFDNAGVQLDKMQGQQAQDAISRLLSQGFTNAMGWRGQDIDRMLNAQQQQWQQQYGSNSLNFDEMMRYVSGLFGMGQQQQNLGQKSADLAYQDFLNQRDYQKNQLNWLMQVLQGATPDAPQTTKTSGGSSPLGDIASILGSLAAF